MRFRLNRAKLKWFVFGGIAALALTAGSAYPFVATSTSEFCMSCHEVRIVGEQGWMKSIHYNNKSGVVAQCADCHLPPGVFAFTYAKIRYGLKDFIVHHTTNPDPYTIDWDQLRDHAREMIVDESCMRCHSNLTPKGMSIKGLVAHREYLRGDTKKKCIGCHTEEFHPKFKEYLFGKKGADAKKEGETK